jgi:NitT/TauT family transport system permease protein
VRAYAVPQFVLPGPSAILSALIADFASLMASLWTTLRITVLAFVLAAVSGIALAILFSQSRILEMMLYPYAVVLQVTPVVAIAPLIIIWVGFERINVALLILAWIVAFFPILANTTLGLRSTDHNLIDLFRLHGASKGQLLWRLKLPSALPFILSGMKTSGGLALIGTVVAEYGAGSGTATGLAWRIIEAGNRLQIPRMFAALILLAGLGIAIFYGLAFLEYLLLRKWHESALPEER